MLSGEGLISFLGVTISLLNSVKSLLQKVNKGGSLLLTNSLSALFDESADIPGLLRVIVEHILKQCLEIIHLIFFLTLYLLLGDHHFEILAHTKRHSIQMLDLSFLSDFLPIDHSLVFIGLDGLDLQTLIVLGDQLAM